ncbi:hypothetical protein [Paludisphaera mucosa]|uniref:Uncharacterized protein n=1 Tax=Paludisphaera mucosa TaxID=3030827 RepID=A0ABT6FJI8_9BACT|nr:hypothetical protein [Paludisphaera mucosa]MDG3007715.1 hypothetical protein [Paludisphaera mucosa]
MSAWLGRRDTSSHGEPERAADSCSLRPPADASVIANFHEQTWNVPTFAQMNLTCCRPAPTTCSHSRKVVSMVSP